MLQDPLDLPLNRTIWSLPQLPWLREPFLNEVSELVEHAVDPGVLDVLALANAIHLLEQTRGFSNRPAVRQWRHGARLWREFRMTVVKPQRALKGRTPRCA